MELVPAMSAVQKGAALLLFTGVAAPLIGVLIRRVSGGWGSFGGGPFALLLERPVGSGGATAPDAPVDPAIQAAEVRQMLEAKAERLRRRGEAPIDVEAETTRLLAEEEASGEEADRDRPGTRIDDALRAEVRQLVISRNERRMRKGLEPLDVEAETDRRLDDLVGSD